MAITFTPRTPFGAEVSGGQFVNREAADLCAAALDAPGGLISRELNISDHDRVTLSHLLGEVVAAKTREHRCREIATITLDPATTNAALAAYRRGNLLWHTNGATDELPQKATLLTAREVNDAGGDTEFANTYLAYQQWPGAERKNVEGLRAMHNFAAAQLRANPDATKQQRTGWESVPHRVHPVVWTRRDDRKSLLIGATTGNVLGLPPKDGTALLARPLEWATQPRFVLRHRLRQDDLVIWDNTGMPHRALLFGPTSRRLMHRTTLAGDEAVA